MADRSTDRDKKPASADVPGDEEFEEEPEDSAAAEGEFEGDESELEEGDEEAFAAATAPSKGRRFGFGRGERSEEPVEKRTTVTGSVRETHERIHIDDRPSAIYALLCAGALLGVLLLTWIGGALPPPAVPTLTPLVVPTGQPTPTPNASPSVTIAPTATPAPSAG
jgi:hypothetical protein